MASDGARQKSFCCVENSAHIERKIFPSPHVPHVGVPVEIAIKPIRYVVGTGGEMPRSFEQLGCVVAELSAQDLA